MSSCEDVRINIAGQPEGMGLPRRIEFLTLLIDGIALKFRLMWYGSSNSLTRWARQTGTFSVELEWYCVKKGNYIKVQESDRGPPKAPISSM